ncbi:MAG: histidinol-phosphate transaminase [Clostridia bacterium]
MNNYLSKLCNEIQPYVAGEQPQDKKYIKLNTNENPYAPSPSVYNAIKNFEIENLRLYPDPENKILKEAIAGKYGVDTTNIFVGNGSDEVLALCFPAFFDRDSQVVFPDITYSFYPVFCNFFGVGYQTIPLNEKFKINLDDYKNIDADGIIIANPNAPTGIALTVNEIEEIVSTNLDKVVIIDEAYTSFAHQSALTLVAKYENLLIVKTFSKSYNLAGVRCGYAVGNANLINGLKRVKNSFNSYTVNYMTERIAAASLLDFNYHMSTVETIIAIRDIVSQKMRMLGFNVLPSSANFILAEHSEVEGNELYKRLKERGILVRYFNKPRISNFIRITVGKREDMETFLEIIADILQIY